MRSLRIFCIFLTLLVSCVKASPLEENAVTWLATSRMVCPVAYVPRGISAECVANVEYFNSSYVVPTSSLVVRNDACTHALRALCAVESTVISTNCTATASDTVLCDYTINFIPPTAASTGGFYMLSLARLPVEEPVHFPETLIVQGIVACGAMDRQVFVAVGVLIVAVLGLLSW